MSLNLQPLLENDKVMLSPLQATDFENLYAVAADPAIWAQHPAKDRWQKEVFATFFAEALQSKGAFKIVDKAGGNIIGSTRYYHYNPSDSSIYIGYTFYAISYWGTGINYSVKMLMLDYIFQHVAKVFLQVGAENIRSQIAIARLGAKRVAAQETTDDKGQLQRHFIYEIRKEDHPFKKTGGNF